MQWLECAFHFITVMARYSCTYNWQSEVQIHQQNRTVNIWGNPAFRPRIPNHPIQQMCGMHTIRWSQCRGIWGIRVHVECATTLCPSTHCQSQSWISDKCLDLVDKGNKNVLTLSRASDWKKESGKERRRKAESNYMYQTFKRLTCKTKSTTWRKLMALFLTFLVNACNSGHHHANLKIAIAGIVRATEASGFFWSLARYLWRSYNQGSRNIVNTLD